MCTSAVSKTAGNLKFGEVPRVQFAIDRWTPAVGHQEESPTIAVAEGVAFPRSPLLGQEAEDVHTIGECCNR